MIVHVEAASPTASEKAREASARQLAGHIKSIVGITTEVRVAKPGQVARSEGKAVRVVDKRPKT